jgi:hypothetical protein
LTPLTPRVVAGAVLVLALVGWYQLYPHLRDISTAWDVTIVGAAVLPATFALVWLALPLRQARGLLAVAVVVAALAAVLYAADAEIAANFAKLAAASLIAFAFISYFEELWWVVVIALLVPLVDAISVWRGPTHHIVTEQPRVFSALSHALPAPAGDYFALGLPDILFFALFLAAAARWGLRVVATWVLMVASFVATIALAVWTDPFGIGGLPALPGLSIAFLLANADLLWRRFRTS